MAGMVAVVAGESQVFDGVGSAIALGKQMFDGHLFAGEVLAAIATVGAILGDESFPFVVLCPGCHVGHIHGSCQLNHYISSFAGACLRMSLGKVFGMYDFRYEFGMTLK